MEPNDTDLATLRGHYLFSGLIDTQLAALRRGMISRQFDQGQMLFQRGQPASEFYLLVDGRVELFVLSRAGDKKVVEIIGPGQTFAEAVMFMRGVVFPVNAQAMLASRLCAISNAHYLAVLKEDPDACLRLLGDVCQRLHARLREIENLTIENAEHRLIGYLLSLTGSQREDAATIELELPRHVIASRLSMQPETLSRLLRNLVTRELIEVDGKRVRLRSLQALRARHL